MSQEVAIRSSRDPRLLARAHGAFGALEGSLTAEERSWLDEVPLDRLVAVLDATPPTARIAAVGPVRRVVDEVHRLGGDAWVDRYARLVMLVLAVRMLTRPTPYRLPPSVDELVASDLDRITGDALSPPAPYKLDADLVLDLGLCRGVLLPFGIQYAQAGFEVKPEVLARAGLAELAVAPWLNMHLRESARATMNQDTRADLFMRVGQFVAENAEYQGLFGVTWWNDPAVAEISPHLAYITEQNRTAGARVVAMKTADAVTIKHATETSRTRRRLYEEGRYTPTDYAIVFPRDELVRWAERRAAAPDQRPWTTSGSARA